MEADLDSLFVDLTHVLYIAGMLHIVHNCMGDLEMVMVHWEWFTYRLRHVCRLLAKKYSRQRLLETCFANPPHSFFRGEYAHFSAGVYEGRWGSVAFAVAKLLLLEQSLRAAWSLAAYNFGSAARPAQRHNDSHHIDMDAVNSAILSDEFLGYARVLDVIAEFLEFIMKWAEGCPCHSPAFRFQGPQRHTAKRRMAAF